MPRNMEESTLAGYAEYFAACWTLGHQIGRPDRNREWLKTEFFNMTFKDEYDYLIDAVSDQLGSKPRQGFHDLVINPQRKDSPRKQKDFEKLLKAKLAIDKNGVHIEGAVGSTVVGGRVMARYMHPMHQQIILNGKLVKETNYEVPRKITWRLYAGEAEERERPNMGAADDWPEYFRGDGVGALVPNISIEAAQAMADALTARLDEGAGAAVIEGRTGAQPADPDAAVTGTLLFTLTCTNPFGPAAADGAPDAVITASAISDDTSADATNTLAYCRISATTTPPTPIDDHVDGECGTSGADFNWNTLSIVSGSTVSMTALTLTMGQGSTAT